MTQIWTWCEIITWKVQRVLEAIPWKLWMEMGVWMIWMASLIGTDSPAKLVLALKMTTWTRAQTKMKTRTSKSMNHNEIMAVQRSKQQTGWTWVWTLSSVQFVVDLGLRAWNLALSRLGYGQLLMLNTIRPPRVDRSIRIQDTSCWRCRVSYKSVEIAHREQRTALPWEFQRVLVSSLRLERHLILRTHEVQERSLPRRKGVCLGPSRITSFVDWRLPLMRMARGEMPARGL